MAKKEPMERVSTQLPSRDKRALERNARENGRSLMSEVRLALDAWLERVGRRT